jgi:hypothetical protein
MARTSADRAATRRRRLAAIEQGGLAAGVEQAFEDLWMRGRRPTSVSVRQELLYRESPADQTPAVARLLSPRGWALRLYLIAVFEAQCRLYPSMQVNNRLPLLHKRPGQVAWLDLVAAHADAESRHIKERATPRRNRLRQLKAALVTLEREGLVELLGNAGRRDRYEGFQLLHEAGRGNYATPNLYTVPAGAEWRQCVRIPTSLFINGWIHALTNAEIAVYLMLQHLRDNHPRAHRTNGVYIYGPDREDHYGLGRDTYETHIMLERFGLVERIEDPRRNSKGRIKNYEPGERYQPHHFRVLAHGLNIRGVEQVLTRLPL